MKTEKEMTRRVIDMTGVNDNTGEESANEKQLYIKTKVKWKHKALKSCIHENRCKWKTGDEKIYT